MSMIFQLLGALVLVAANGFFVATEFAVTRLRPTQVEEFERQGKPGSKSVRHAVDHLDAYLAACQLGITVASLGLGVLGEPAFSSLLESVFGPELAVLGLPVAVIVAFLIITLLHVVIGELAAKSLAIAAVERTSLMVAPPMRLFYLSTKPVVDLFNGMGNLLLRPFGIPPAGEVGHDPHTEDELRSLVRQSGEEGLINEGERELTENVFLFGERRAREVMVPRPEVDFLTTDTNLTDAIGASVRTGHTRLPLCEPEGLDAVVGILNAKDLLPVVHEDREIELSEVARSVLRLPESTRVDELLRRLRGERQHLAVLEDEHGTTVGIVTLEDVLEEIVGEIEDEFDPRAAEMITAEGDDLVVDGRAPLRLVAERLAVSVPDAHEATIGGHLLEQLGRLPQRDESVELDGRRARVLELEGARIARLRFEGPPQDEAGEEDIS